MTTELLGAMIGWMSGDRRKTSAVVRGGFEPMMRLIEHIDCYPEICILEKYGRTGGVTLPPVTEKKKKGIWSSWG